MICGCKPGEKSGKMADILKKSWNFLNGKKVGTLWLVILIILPEFEKDDMNLEFNLSLNGNVIHMCN